MLTPRARVAEDPVGPSTSPGWGGWAMGRSAGRGLVSSRSAGRFLKMSDETHYIVYSLRSSPRMDSGATSMT